MFDIGQKIACCEDYKLPHTIEELSKNMPNWVKKNDIYTVRGFNDNNGIVTGILLEEVSNPILYFKLLGYSQEGSFRLDRFRELKEDEVMITEEIEEPVIS